MTMKGLLILSLLLALTAVPGETRPAGRSAGAAPAKQSNAAERPLKLSRSDLRVDWAIQNTQEQPCSGEQIAGGASSGEGNFTHLGSSRIEVSAAWDVGHLLDPGDVQFVPVGPAGGPVAPVLGADDYPYGFQFNPFTGECEAVVSATGTVKLTAANGDQVFGAIRGGEAHRLDFVNPGDGVETFAITDIVGGTGRFENATGSFVAHTITRFDYDALKFVIDLTEVLPGGIIVY
jgi:hypothetical protein